MRFGLGGRCYRGYDILRDDGGGKETYAVWCGVVIATWLCKIEGNRSRMKVWCPMGEWVQKGGGVVWWEK